MTGHRVGLEIIVTAGEQKAALTGLRALHQAQDANELIAHGKRVLDPIVIGLVARAKPECSRKHQRRENGCNEQAPIEQSKRF